jgi:hypothetical protein
MHGIKANAHRVLVGRKSLAIPCRRLEDNIKIGLKIQLEGVY